MTPQPTERPYDLIVGGGINDTGIARDAAPRGLRTLLLEQDDPSAATSTWNSRMIQGGMKCLEHGEIGLVHELLREREWLLRAAPHLVKPLLFMMPFLRRNRRGSLILRAGMLAYDVLSFDKSLPMHRILSRESALEVVPGIDRDEIRGAALFYDAQAEFAERLSVENALGAEQAGASVLVHTPATRLVVEAGRVTGVEYRDELTGETGLAQAPVTVNAAGPWADAVLATIGGEQRRRIGGTKGTHLVVDPFPGAPRYAMYYEAAADGRPVLVIPWRGRYVIGSTDVRAEGDPGEQRADDAEFEYILGETNRLIPSAGLTRDSVRLVYTGVRPLPYMPGVPESKIPRSHLIVDHAPELEGLFTIVGGKLTTFRSLADQTVSKVERKLGRQARRSATRTVPLPGGVTRSVAAEIAALAIESDLPPATAARLVGIYGSRARLVAELVAEHPELGRPLREDVAMIGAEVVMALRHEHARTLEDVFHRRAMLAFDAPIDAQLREAAAWIAEAHAGWTDAWIADDLAGRHGRPSGLWRPSGARAPAAVAGAVRDDAVPAAVR